MAFLPDVAGAFWRLALADVLILFARAHRPGEAARDRWRVAMASVDSQQNSMLPGEAEQQSAPAACPPSTLYSFEYHEYEIENADAA